MILHWKELFLALFLAAALWYSVSGSEKIETQVDVRLEYKGLPNGLIIREGLPTKITARVRASVGVLRSIDSRVFTYSLDLSSITKGLNVIPLVPEQLPFWGGIEVIDVTPSVIELSADTIEKKELALNLLLAGTVPPNFTLTTKVVPDTAEVSGPSNIVSAIQTIPLSFTLPEEIHTLPEQAKLFIPVPEGVTVVPHEVTVLFTLTEKTELVQLTQPVSYQTEDFTVASITPATVKLTLKVPQSLAKHIDKHADILVTAQFIPSKSGTYRAPLTVTLPTNVELVSIAPQHVTLTITAPQKPSTPIKVQGNTIK